MLLTSTPKIFVRDRLTLNWAENVPAELVSKSTDGHFPPTSHPETGSSRNAGHKVDRAIARLAVGGCAVVALSENREVSAWQATGGCQEPGQPPHKNSKNRGPMQLSEQFTSVFSHRELGGSGSEIWNELKFQDSGRSSVD